MPEPSTEMQEYDIFRKLSKRMKVIASGSGQVYLNRSVQPVVNALRIMREYRIAQATDVATVAATAGYHSIQVIPRGERWTIRAINCELVTGDTKIDRFTVRDSSTGITMTETLFAGTAAARYQPANVIVMDELDELKTRSDGSGAAASAFSTYLSVYIELLNEPG